MKFFETGESVTLPEEIKDIIQIIANDFPSTIRFPFINPGSHKFNAAYSIMHGVENKLLLFIADTSDRERLGESELLFDSDGFISIFAVVQSRVFSFRLGTKEIRRIQDPDEVSKTFISAKHNFNLKNLAIQPALSFFKTNLLNRNFKEFIEIEFPTEIYVLEQKRLGLRCPIPRKALIKADIFMGTNSKEKILDSTGITNEHKSSLSRFLNLMANEKRPLPNIFIDFISKFPNALTSPYFDLTQKMKPDEYVDLIKTEKITSDYPSFENLKTIIIKNRSDLYSEPRLSLPLFIYGEVEGHIMFLKCEPPLRNFYKKAVAILSLALENNKYFSIYSKQDSYLIDLGTKGLRFRSSNPNHKRLKTGSSFFIEFLLNWTARTPLRIGVESIELIETLTAQNTHEFDIKCKFDSSLGNNDYSLVRIDKYVRMAGEMILEII